MHKVWYKKYTTLIITCHNLTSLFPNLRMFLECWMSYIEVYYSFNFFFFRFKELHPQFFSPEKSMGEAAFFRARPKHVLSFTKAKLKACLCDVCENPRLKMKALNNKQPGVWAALHNHSSGRDHVPPGMLTLVSTCWNVSADNVISAVSRHWENVCWQYSPILMKAAGQWLGGDGPSSPMRRGERQQRRSNTKEMPPD